MNNLTMLFSLKNNPKKKSQIFKKRSFSGQTIDFLPRNQVFIYQMRIFPSLTIMNIEILSLILVFVTLKYFKNLCIFFRKLFKN